MHARRPTELNGALDLMPGPARVASAVTPEIPGSRERRRSDHCRNASCREVDVVPV